MDFQEEIPSMKECLDILMPIAETEETISCLQSFLQSQELIRWFKEEPMVAGMTAIPCSRGFPTLANVHGC